jgi:hypothetical protein
MAMNDGPNLDRLAAEHAQQFIRLTFGQKHGDVDNTVTKALGVLQEDGLYACFLYLLAKEKDKGKHLTTEMLGLLEKLGFGWGKPSAQDAASILKHLTDKVTVDLERLLLAKEVLEQMLIYARYGAKARCD